MYQKMLIAIDPEEREEARCALETAIDLLAEDSELHLSSIYKPGDSGFFPHVPEDSPKQKEVEVREKLEKLVSKYLPSNRSVSLHVVAGNTGEKLVDLAGQLCADLLIVVCHGNSRHWLKRRATVEYVAVNAPCPVLVLPLLEQSGSQKTEEEDD